MDGKQTGTPMGISEEEWQVRWYSWNPIHRTQADRNPTLEQNQGMQRPSVMAVTHLAHMGNRHAAGYAQQV